MSVSPRRTKIVCTLGPSSSNPDTIRDMIRAGMDVARLNFSHGEHADHKERVEVIREEARQLGREVAILQDLQGPKIRVGKMKDNGVLVHEGGTLTLTTEPLEFGTSERAFISYPNLPYEVEPGRRILIDDGALEVVITDVRGADVITEVIVGGTLRSRKGVNLPDLRSSRPSLTEKDLADLEFGLSLDIDLMALSFVRSAEDVADLLRRIRKSGKRINVIAKIEKPEAVRAIDNIISIADGIMVARGDLGIEIPLAEVPGVQKSIIGKCLRGSKPVITATQMLESMMQNPRPTRAEASDVANAVLDGTDAVMLSGETAAGKYPVRVVQVMAEIIREAERHREYRTPQTTPDMFNLNAPFSVTDSISKTAVALAEQVGASAIACLSSTGTTTRSIARHRPSVPVYAFTDIEKVVRQMQVLWGTRAFQIPFQRDTDQGVKTVLDMLREHGLIESGNRVVMTAGMPLPEKGSTNMVHVTQA